MTFDREISPHGQLTRIEHNIEIVPDFIEIVFEVVEVYSGDSFAYFISIDRNDILS
jgi:hypothetical protein